MTTNSTQALLATLMSRELRALRREVERYPDDEAPWREIPGVSNVGGTLVLHLAGNLQHYVGARLGDSGYRRDRAAEFARRGVPRAALVAEIDRAREVVERVLPALADDRLDTPYPEAVAGRTMCTRDFLMHLLSHLAYHLGQVDYHRRIAAADATPVDAIALSELGIS